MDGLRKWPVINLIGGGLVFVLGKKCIQKNIDNIVNQITLLFGRHLKSTMI